MKRTFIRCEDGKAFKIVSLGHWSTIQSDDGETDSVKIYGGDSTHDFYIGASSGFAYTTPRQTV